MARVKALFLPANKPYEDMGEVVQIARAEGCKVLCCRKVKVLNILSCSYPTGYVVVVQNSSGKGESQQKE